MGTAKRVDTFLLPLLLLSIFVNFITKRAYYTSPDGISITFHRCDLYDGIDSFDLSTFYHIKSKYVTTTKKCLFLLLLCGDIESQPGPTNNSEFKTLISKKGIKFCHQNIILRFVWKNWQSSRNFIMIQLRHIKFIRNLYKRRLSQRVFRYPRVQFY